MAQSIISKRTSNFIRIISIIAIVAMMLISVIVYRTDTLKLLIFSAFLLFYDLLPGALINRMLCIRTGHISSDILLSFFSGWTLIVGEYFITELISTNILLLAFGPILSVLYILISFRQPGCKIRLSSFSLMKVPAAFYLFIVLLMAYVMLTTQFLYMSPEYCDNIYVSMDKAYQMGLISQLSKGYPLINPWVSGRIVHYHIFTQILLSIPVRLFGITPDFAVMSCNPLLTISFIGLAVYSMFRYFCRHKDRAGLYALTFMLSNMFIARTENASYLFRIMLTNDNYGGSGAACAVAWILLLAVYLHSFEEKRNGNTGQLILLTLSMMLFTGVKAPDSLVVVGGLIGTVLLGLLLRKVSLNKLPVVILSSVAFFIVYKAMLGDDGTSGISGESIIGFGEVTDLSYWKSGLIEVMKADGVPYVIRLAVILAGFAVFFFSIYLLPFVIGYIREFILVVRGRKEFDIARVTIYASALVGFTLMMLLRYYGHSQIYFGTITAIFMPLVAFWFFEDLEQGCSKWMSHLGIISAAVFFVSMVFSAGTLMLHYQSLVPGAVAHADPKSSYNAYMSLTAGEFEAVKWLRQNTDDDALIATQMYSCVGYDEYNVESRWHNVHFMYASYSGRNFYLEGSGFSLDYGDIELRAKMVRNTNRIFDPEDKERAELAKSLGINYAFVTKSLHPVGDLSSDHYRRVFSNDDVDIYEIN